MELCQVPISRSLTSTQNNIHPASTRETHHRGIHQTLRNTRGLFDFTLNLTRTLQMRGFPSPTKTSSEKLNLTIQRTIKTLVFSNVMLSPSSAPTGFLFVEKKMTFSSSASSTVQVSKLNCFEVSISFSLSSCCSRTSKQS